MRRIVTCSVTAAGAAVAKRLPYEHRPGRLVATVGELWDQVDGLVLIAATGIAVRAIAPHLVRKDSDPAVVSVDDKGAFVVALAGGHARGANHLAADVAALLQATPVVTTATDGAGIAALDELPGLKAEGDLSAVTRSWLDGEPPDVEVDPELGGWVLPLRLDALRRKSKPAARTGRPTRVVLSDLALSASPDTVLLRPPSLVVGVGASTGADPAALERLIDSALRDRGLSGAAVHVVATLDRKSTEPAIQRLAERLGAWLRAFPAAALARVPVPTPSPAVEAAVGTPSVCEAAALLAAGPGAELVAPKRISDRSDSTLAIARRRSPEGHLAVVGLGPGHAARRTPEATIAIRSANVVIGYGPYVDMVGDLLSAHHEVLRSPIGAESERCRLALQKASAGHQVALVCSGDPGVYAMASLVCELAPDNGDPPVTVVPGITAALSGAAVLGAPLGHDHAAVSLSDLLTPWDVIVRRLEAAGAGDFVVSLYNPRSSRRTRQLREALDILGKYRVPSTPAAILTDIGRAGQTVVRTSLAELDPSDVTMLSLVVVGSGETRWIGGRMVTPRGYGAPLG